MTSRNLEWIPSQYFGCIDIGLSITELKNEFKRLQGYDTDDCVDLYDFWHDVVRKYQAWFPSNLFKQPTEMERLKGTISRETQERLYPKCPDWSMTELFEKVLHKPLLFRDWSNAKKRDVNNWLLCYYHGGV